MRFSTSLVQYPYQEKRKTVWLTLSFVRSYLPRTSVYDRQHSEAFEWRWNVQSLSATSIRATNLSTQAS